jgi:hypothetical protein
MLLNEPDMKFIGQAQLQALGHFCTTRQVLIVSRRRVQQNQPPPFHGEPPAPMGSTGWRLRTIPPSSYDFSQALFHYDHAAAALAGFFPVGSGTQPFGGCGSPILCPQLVVIDEFTYLIRNDRRLLACQSYGTIAFQGKQPAWC